VTPETVFDVGTITHYNNPVTNGIESVRLTITLRFSDPAMTLGTPPSIIQVDETANVQDVGDCTYPSTTPCADKITFPSTTPGSMFVFNGTKYALQILGFKNPVTGARARVGIVGGWKDATLPVMT